MKRRFLIRESMLGHILRILAGVLDFIAAGIALYYAIGDFVTWGYSGVHSLDDFLSDFPIALTQVILPPAAGILGAIFPLVGGFCVLTAKKWRLAFTGSIFTLLAPITYLVISLIWTHRLLSYVGILVGVAAVVLTLLSRQYFIRQISPK
jgi:hypothetical protein